MKTTIKILAILLLVGTLGTIPATGKNTKSRSGCY